MARRLSAKLVAFAAALVTGAAALTLFRAGRGYPWMLAVIAALAVAVLAWGSVVTFARLAPLWAPLWHRRGRPPGAGSR